MKLKLLLISSILFSTFNSKAVLNYALSFPGGSSGSASNVAIPALNISALPVTIEMWFKPDATQNYYSTLMYNRSTSNSGIQYDRWGDTGKIKLVWNGTQPASLHANKPVAGQWNHVAYVITSSSKTMILNGVAQTETGSFANYPMDAVTYLGWDNALADRTFKGLIDEVRIWNTARTTDEIEQNKYKTLIGSENGLIGYWNFDDQAVTATDLTANKRNGTISGAVYLASSILDTMEYVASTTTQRSLTLDPHTANLIVMTLRIDTKNDLKALSLSKLNISTNGTTNYQAVAKAKVFYTGNSEKFTNAKLIAETTTFPLTDIHFTANQALVSGSNYFHIVYELNSNISHNDAMDTECLSFELNSENGNKSYEPAVKAPAGKTIIDTETNVSTVTSESAKFTGNIGVNFVAFQQSAIMTYKGFQYITYWNKAYRVCIARRAVPDGKWQEVEFADYTSTQTRIDDNHYNISMGICESDGTIHLSYDHHNDPLNYRVSVNGLANDTTIPWTAASFGGNLENLGAGVQVTFDGSFTYPRFVSMPNGNMLFEARSGTSGDGNSHLWEYNGSTHLWLYIGEYMHGRTGTSAGYTSKCGYINGLHYTPGGTRLHVSFVWRETPSAPSNHEVYYAYSDDNGRTWFNDAGVKVATTGSDPLHYDKTSLKILSIGENRGLINQESQAVDKNGKIHILQSYMLDTESSTTNWLLSRQKAYMRHIYKDSSGVWQKDLIDLSNINRSQIAVDGSNNLYVVAPNYRVYTAKASEGWKSWKAVDLSGSTKAISEGQIDREMLLQYNILQFAFPHSDNDGKLSIPSYKFDNTTLLPDNLKEESLKIYPNPSKDLFTIDSRNAFEYQIIDSLGKIVEKGTGNQKASIGSQLHQGTYFVRVEQENLKLISKLIKI